MKRRHFLISLSVVAAAILPAFVQRLLRKYRYKPAVNNGIRPKRSIFDENSTAEQVTNGIDLSGKTALITGCNSGIGLETMRVLALRGAHVYGSARSLEKAEAACDSVKGLTSPLVIELTDFDSVVDAANEFKNASTKLDILILNAGVMALPNLEQVYGLEKQFVVNHLGHFLLTTHLLDRLKNSRGSRTVILSSRAYRWAPEEGIQFDNLDGKKGYTPRSAYGQSKLANALFSRELSRRLVDSHSTSNAVHPGVVETNLSRHIPVIEGDEKSVDYTIKTIPEGAATTCYVATNPSLNGVTGYYFADCKMEIPAAIMQDDEMAKRLWDISEDLVSEFV